MHASLLARLARDLAAAVAREEARRAEIEARAELAPEPVSLVPLVEEGERKAEIERQRRAAEHAAWVIEEESRRRARALKESRQELAEIIELWSAEKRLEQFFADAELSIADLTDDEHRFLSERLRAARELLGNTDALPRLAKWRLPGER